MKMKYIIFSGEFDMETPVLFPVFVQHDAVAFKFHNFGWEPLSAGFVTVEKDQFTAFGRSDSLNLDSAPEDSQLIQNSWKVFS